MIIQMHGKRAILEFPRGATHIADQMKSKGWYERRMLEDIKAKRPRGVALDVGAYCGTHSVWFGLICDLEVKAFEPVRESYMALCDNIGLNRLGRKITPYNIAAGSEYGRASFQRLDELNTGTDKIINDAQGTIPVVPLDDFGFKQVGLVKIDVEGAELNVLKGLRSTLLCNRPLVYIEAATEEEQAQVSEFMQPLGYEVFNEFNTTPTFGWSYRGRHRRSSKGAR